MRSFPVNRFSLEVSDRSDAESMALLNVYRASWEGCLGASRLRVGILATFMLDFRQRIEGFLSVPNLVPFEPSRVSNSIADGRCSTNIQRTGMVGILLLLLLLRDIKLVKRRVLSCCKILKQLFTLAPIAVHIAVSPCIR